MKEIELYLMSAHFWVSAAVVVCAMVASSALRRCAKKYLGHYDGKRATNAHLGVTLIQYSLFAFAVAAILQINGIDVTSLITGLGIVGIVVGFSLQDMLKDLIMGATIVRNRFYDIGDVVKYKNIEGVVTAFNIKVTKIRDVYTGNTVTVCNRNISEIECVADRFDIILQTSYDEDYTKIRKMCADICSEIKKIDKIDNCRFEGTDDFASSSVNYRIRVFCPAQNKPELRRAALGVMQEMLNERGVQIPYAQTDVHIKQ